ncbi:MAG: hypothetical protein PHN56_01330 [Candidatus Nanoarchaeia archaeon]|nr:hypothetical protein [Candidatus Nanoarchaeia archaeon]
MNTIDSIWDDDSSNKDYKFYKFNELKTSDNSSKISNHYILNE